MTAQVLLITILLVCGAVCGAVDSQKSNLTAPDKPQAPTTKPKSSSNNTNVEASATKTATNVDVPNSHSDIPDMIVDSSMFSRAAYFLTGISVVLLLYFTWKSLSLRKRPTHIHKYGVVASREDLEMTALGFGSEDEEDDTTHFDIGKHQRS